MNLPQLSNKLQNIIEQFERNNEDHKTINNSLVVDHRDLKEENMPIKGEVKARGYLEVLGDQIDKLDMICKHQNHLVENTSAMLNENRVDAASISANR